MKLKLNIVVIITVMLVFGSCKNKEQKQTTTDITLTDYYNEPYRPQFHFSPEEKWMNDPNGLVYHQGAYHLFYQYYPEDVIWGPMHWGHVVSKDLIYWEHKPIALYPDEHAMILFQTLINPPQKECDTDILNSKCTFQVFSF